MTESVITVAAIVAVLIAPAWAVYEFFFGPHLRFETKRDRVLRKMREAYLRGEPWDKPYVMISPNGCAHAIGWHYTKAFRRNSISIQRIMEGTKAPR